MTYPSIFEELTTPSNFRGDWQGYAGNQGTHTLIGLLSVGFICAVTLWLKGDIPYKINIFAGMAFIYGFKEIAWDKWHGFDTIEDFMFVVCYGAGGTLVSFTQSEANTSKVYFEAGPFLFVLLLFCIHISCGIAVRKREAENGSTD